MPHISLRASALLLLTSVGVYAAAQIRPHAVTTTQRRDPVYAGMVGRWQGTLEVRDSAGVSGRRRHPTQVRVSADPKSDALEMHVTTRDGRRELNDTDHLQLDTALTTARWGGMGSTPMQVYDVRVADSLTAHSPLRIVMERAPDCDSLSATIRETVTIAPGRIRITQEQKSPGGTFEFKREYVLQRVG